MTQDSNAGERNEDQNEPEAPRELTPQEIQAARELQEIADGHRYMPQEMRDAKDALGKKPERPKKAPKKDDKLGTGERIAKVLARAGLASRREIERLIGLGKIAVNGRILETPAVLVKATDIITVDGQVVGKAEPTRLWRYHKPVGLVTTERDPSGRPTVFDKLPADLPRVLKVGRLDLNSEGLLLLTNDGELARALELPSAGWVRRYRARALGHTTQARLDALKDGTTVEGVIYGPMEATLDKLAEKADGRANVWITVSITEGKNREVRKVLESIGLKVNRLIRLAYGPFQLGNLEPGEVEEIGPRVIRELLGEVIQLRNLPPEGASQTRNAPMPRYSSEGGTPAGRRGGGDRFEKKAFGDKPAFGAKKFGDKKFGDKAGEWKPRTEFEKRDFKERDFDERPRFEGDGEARDRRPAPAPSREYGDRKPFGDKPREWKPRAEGAEHKSYGDRPKRDFGDRPQGDRPAFKKPYAARDNAGGERSYDRPKRDYGANSRQDGPQGGRPAFKKPYAARDSAPAGEAGAYERAKREFGGAGGEKKAMTPRPEGAERKPYGDRPERPAFKKPYASRDNAGGGERSYSDRPKRDYGDRPTGDRPAFKKPYAAREGAEGGERRSYMKPNREGSEQRPAGDRPAFKKPYASRDGAGGGERKSYGDKPRPAGGGFKSDRPRPDRPAGGGFKGAPRGDRPTGARPSGDRPSGGRPSGAPRPGGKPNAARPPFKPRRDS
ncbi:pseudouridine synthase [Asticcacaulis sp.]|uniref:pseudouridine synthase n=1 Tax=Asticcacaulis sp. TaxID=1872648 RepID=UPI002B720765|nr:pseudouridine synthase [Asticcacaulis sp.]HTM81780.1 pseudouridine synthase [Asticcacaulis sp.]